MRDVHVVGVATTPFGRHTERSYVDLGVDAVRAALADAGVPWPEVQRAYCGAVAPIGPVAGNLVGQQLGLTGLPIQNVDNASASGNAAVHMAWQAVATEQCEIALAFGVGQMGRTMPSLDEQQARQAVAQARSSAMTLFALAAQRRMHERGTPPEVFGRIAVKSKLYGSLNPNAQIRTPMSLEEVMAARPVADPLTRPMCCPVGDGAAAVVLASPAAAARLDADPVRLIASMMFGETHQPERAWGHGLMVAAAASALYEETGVGPADLDLVELHDATANEELEYYEALGLCSEGEGDRLVMDGETGPGGSIPVNTDGGLMSRGHPLGPTGCAQVAEVVLQLRGGAGDRQVEGARTGLVQQTGMGEVFFLHLLQR